MKTSREHFLAPTNVYLSDTREFEFFMWELFRVQDHFLNRAPFNRWNKELFEQIFILAKAFAKKLSDCYQQSDVESCELLEDGTVRLPEAFLPLWEEYRRDWIPALANPGAAAGDIDPNNLLFPPILCHMIYEMFMGANPSFMTYGGFSRSAAKLVHQSGTVSQKNLLVQRLLKQEWDACFCATEPQAGSDITAIRTAGTSCGDGIFHISGEKKFISAGMHRLTENTVYFVLGRTENSSENSYSLSCFLVPKYWIEADGTMTDNHVECIRIERKMGLKACANTHLLFGQSGTSRAYLLGDRENGGLLQLLPLMNEARVSTGLFGIGMASSAYLHSLQYARKRVQGRSFDRVSDAKAPRIAIIEHLDVQRMLLEMKSKVEGCRGLIGKLSFQASTLRVLAEQEQPDENAQYRAQKLLQFYVPIVKAYVSDQAWRICESAIQVHGGIGYTTDSPVEQYARDVKILSIWEGTNYLQSQDLLRDKLAFGRDSRTIRYFSEEVGIFLERAHQFPEFSVEFSGVEAALNSVVDTLNLLASMVKGGQLIDVSQYATRFLEMLGETCVSWVLLEAACIAHARLRTLGESDADWAFYQGKMHTARFFIHNILPEVATKTMIIRNHAHSLVRMPDAYFGFIREEAGSDDNVSQALSGHPHMRAT